MNKHLYLRAYLAGIAVPTLLLLGIMTGYTILRYAMHFPVPIERVIVFPMAVVPNLWGLWNIIFVASHERLRISIGVHGMILPFFLAPLGMLAASLLDFPVPRFVFSVLPLAGPVALIAYYLAWKYLVSGLNSILGIA